MLRRLVHGLVPGLLFGGDVHRRLGGLAVVARPRAGVHDLAGAGGIVARRGIGAGILALAFAVLALAVLVLSIRPVTAVAVVLAVAIVGGTGRVAGAVVLAVRRGLGAGRRGGAGGAGGCVAVVPGIAVLGRRQVVVGLLDAEVVPGFRVGRQREPGVANERMGDELRGHLPAFRVALGPAGVVLQGAGHHHPRHRGLDEVRLGLRHPLRRVADLVAVRRQRLTGGIGPEREPQHEAPEEGLLAQKLRYAVADS